MSPAIEVSTMKNGNNAIKADKAMWLATPSHRLPVKDRKASKAILNGASHAGPG